MAELSQAVRRSESAQYPYFSAEFEALCQYHDVSAFWNNQGAVDPEIQTVLPLLAGRPARSLDSSNLQSQVPNMLHRISLFSGAATDSSSALALRGVVPVSLLEKLVSVNTTNLGQMDMLEAEKRILSKTISLSSRQITADQSMCLRQILARLTAELVACQRDFFEPQCAERLIAVLQAIQSGELSKNQALIDVRSHTTLPGGHFFQVFAEQSLPALISSLQSDACTREERIRNTGLAAVQLAVMLLRLFVPDKPFDPSLGLVVQRKQHSQRLAEITAKSEAISSFEITFSGQPSNMRSDILQDEIRDLGSAPQPSSVSRPQKSQLSLLQGEFSNLITTILNRNPEQMIRNAESVQGSQEMVRLLRENIRHLNRRLSTHYRSYADLTVPVVRFLDLLDVGLFLGSSQPEPSGELLEIQTVSQRTPFLGGTLHPVLGQKSSSSAKNAIELRFQELSALWAAKDADPAILHSKPERDAIRRVFADFHHLWKTKLKEDQELEAQKSDLYRYRGSWEDDEEVNQNEMHGVFPTYEDDSFQDGDSISRIDPRAISVRLASLHAKIAGGERTGVALSTFVKESARLLGSIWSENKAAFSPMQPQDHLPAVFLLLNDAITEGSSDHAKNYNFYTDSNLIEARRLVSLTLSAQSRFVQIQASWPEHTLLQDVITCCTEILQFQHTEPVAKFMTKVEKLHSLVHEWQLVASREYSAAPLYDEITNMIISWRRLELSTWAKLLDIEKEKCDDDVSAWWFVAYEALMGVPIQMAESGQEIGHHIQGAMSTLELFFHSTTLGHFTQRLRLVENFRTLLAVFVRDFDCFKQLVSALDNFIQHYRPFESAVDKLLAEKRSALEKDIKERIQVASWKDTNIIALRESARRSHVKLFKLVRKYREVLAQPVQPVLEQGLPDVNSETSPTDNTEPARSVALPPEALAICQKDDALWSNRALRFQNPGGTTRNMANLYSSLPSEFDISKDLDGFTVSVIEGINEFKSQTPKILTEENKDDVQHLKIQKRRLYADTLKRLFEMGVKRNAGTSLIESQQSLAQVLANSAGFECGTATSSSIQSAESYFHRLLDLLPRARLASRNYSEELSNVEVFRSMGSIEHLLFMIRRQRNAISPALTGLGTLKATLDKMQNLWTAGSSALLSKADSADLAEQTDLTRIIAWLAPILGLAAEIVDVHSKFSGINASTVCEELRSRKAVFEKLRHSLETLPALPPGITCKSHQQAMQETWSSLEKLSLDLKKWSQSRPDLSFALDQIGPWVKTNITDLPASHEQGDLCIQSFDSSLLAAIDKMLIGLQKLKDVPSTVDFPGFVSRSDEFFSRALKAVYLTEITSSLDTVLNQLQCLQDHSGDLPVAAALIASILPIASQYYAICRDLTDRFISVHREICKTSYVLTKTFNQVACEGFCSPVEASQDDGKEGKLESGTGLGDGEGAEDISKDIGNDEDLSELAQQEQKHDASQEMDDSADAVNMDHEELKAEAGDHQEGEEEEKDESGEEGEDDIDEEVGSVDDLDPAAVDEKLWDGFHDEDQKESENQEGKGKSESEQQAAAKEQKGDDDGEKGDEESQGDEEEEAPDDEGEAVGREEMDVTDPQTKEQEALDLPEEMQLDGDEKEGGEDEEDDAMDDISDMGYAPEDDEKADKQDDKPGDEDAEMAPEEQVPGEDEEITEEEDADEAEGEEETGAGGEDPEEPQQDDFLAQRDENEAAGDNVAPSEAVTGGLGAEQDQNEEKGASGDAQQESGSTDPAAHAEQQTGAAKDGEDSKRSRDAGGGDNMSPNDPQMQAFKKLGDILEQWHRRQKEVLEASQEEQDSQPLPQDTDMADADFEHLKEDDDVADSQALGQASEEQARALDQNKGVESEVKPGQNEALPDASDEHQGPEAKQLEDEMQLDRDTVLPESHHAGAFIPGGQSQNHADGAPSAQEATEELDEVDSQLAAIHLSSSLPPLTPQDEARRLWSHYESATNDLSLSLTEQLRLILAPTLATKLRGDFRTGKRLNIKRIIPYIASQYKRDKIWMRRSIPSKRNYQIMLAVDDSKSMLEGGSGQLAFETLALVAKSLSMLEAGDLCILSFGNEDHVRVAHDFGKPFSSQAGMQVFQHFSYQQTGTNVRKLISDSIALFREARWKRSPASGAADLWQLELIISDGICEEHDSIRRLVRQALEDRIMIVFIIVDAFKGSSILDLSQASFEPDSDANGEMKLKMKRYLEGFPFPYYLVVRDVRELPAVLATALKQWFAEVVDVSS